MKKFPKRIMDLIKTASLKGWEDGDGMTYVDDADAAIAWIEAAQKPLSDADQRDLTIGRAINRCAMELPDGTSVICDIELGQATVFWSHEDDTIEHLVDSDAEFSERILHALELTKKVRQ